MILAQSLQPPSPKASRWTWGIPGLLASKKTLQPEGTLPGGAWRGVGGPRKGSIGEPGCLRCLCLSMKKSKSSLQAASLTNCPFNLLKSAPGLRLALA